MDQYNGSLDAFLNIDYNSLRKELLALYGVGEETADSIILYAAGKPVFVVDAYLGFFEEDASYKQMQKLFTENLKEDVRLYNEYHALIVAVGNRFCTGKKPKCNECPLQDLCNKDFK